MSEQGAHESAGAEVDPDAVDFVYDEFAWFGENCAEYGLPVDPMPEVVRLEVEVGAGSADPRGHDPSISMLRWGLQHPEIVFLHGAAQNAHTWDSVVLALRPTAAVAVDLPGHGRSSWREDVRYDPHTNAMAVAEALGEVLERPVVLVGMSLGGLTANRIAATHPELVSALVVVDITPGVTRDKAREIHEFIAGPQRFASFSEIFERTVEFNPTRSRSSLRRGVLHNAHRCSDGTWEWNYHRAQPDGTGFAAREDLWADIGSARAPYLLVRGGISPVVDDEDVTELLARQPPARVERVEGAGHSIQGDRPLELSSLLRAEIDSAATR